jgi:hypothetical protein
MIESRRNVFLLPWRWKQQVLSKRRTHILTYTTPHLSVSLLLAGYLLGSEKWQTTRRQIPDDSTLYLFSLYICKAVFTLRNNGELVSGVCTCYVRHSRISALCLNMITQTANCVCGESKLARQAPGQETEAVRCSTGLCRDKAPRQWVYSRTDESSFRVIWLFFFSCRDLSPVVRYDSKLALMKLRTFRNKKSGGTLTVPCGLLLIYWAKA